MFCWHLMNSSINQIDVNKGWDRDAWVNLERLMRNSSAGAPQIEVTSSSGKVQAISVTGC